MAAKLKLLRCAPTSRRADERNVIRRMQTYLSLRRITLTLIRPTGLLEFFLIGDSRKSLLQINHEDLPKRSSSGFFAVVAFPVMRFTANSSSMLSR